MNKRKKMVNLKKLQYHDFKSLVQRNIVIQIWLNKKLFKHN